MLAQIEIAGKGLAFLLQPAAPLLALALAVALLHRRLHHYWAITLYCALVSVHGALGFFTDIDQQLSVYISFRCVELALVGFVAWQLGHRCFVNYPSLAAFATRALWILLPLCVVLAFTTALTDPAPGADRHPQLQLTYAIERSINTAILTFLLAIGGFAGWFPVRMKQNSARLLIGFIVIHAYHWIFLLAANTHWQWTYWGDFWRSFIYAQVLFYWLFTLTSGGEVTASPTVARWDQEHMEKLNGQLNQIQAQLARHGF